MKFDNFITWIKKHSVFVLQDSLLMDLAEREVIPHRHLQSPMTPKYRSVGEMLVPASSSSISDDLNPRFSFENMCGSPSV